MMGKAKKALGTTLPPAAAVDAVVDVPTGSRKPLVAEEAEEEGDRGVMVEEGEGGRAAAPPTSPWLELPLRLLAPDWELTRMVPVQAAPVGQQPMLPAPSVEQIALEVQQAPTPLGSAEQGR
jgi:hypothetical protein